MTALGIAVEILGSLAFSAQDKYTLRAPDGLAFSDFKGVGCPVYRHIRAPKRPSPHLAGLRPRICVVTSRQREFFNELRNRLNVDLAAYGIARDRYGLIHADFVPENVLEDGGRLRVIDPF
jgi:hypothetical protein